ncbi:MAG: hypothetical protein AAF613_05440 [Pseudomonadota bacterium]
MLTIVSATCLLYAACALLYQADERRAVYERVRRSPRVRLGMRAVAVAIFAVTLTMIAPLQGWELGIPVWFGLFSFTFVAGLFLSAQRPELHPQIGGIIGGLGIIAAIGALAA